MSKKHRFDPDQFRVKPGEKLDLSKRSTKAGKELRDKSAGLETLAEDIAALKEAQEILYASGKHSMLIILQGMDAAGKDGTIKHVMSAVNPQGCRVYSFKAPSEHEQKHHFLWRAGPCLPPRGMISIFNRSYYEETLVVRVHPEYLEPQALPGLDISKPKSLAQVWKRRFREIKAFEQALADNGTLILKFYLHLSKDEQRERFLERLTRPEKYWKFNSRDLTERKLFPEYRKAFEETLSNTSTQSAPWFVVPADNKWYTRAAIADIIASTLESQDLKYPRVPPDESANFEALAEALRNE